MVSVSGKISLSEVNEKRHQLHTGRGNGKHSTVSIPTHIKIIQTKKVASNATSTAATNVQPHVQIVKSKSRPLPSIPQEKQCGSEQERVADTQKLEEITTDDNEDIYLYTGQTANWLG